LQTLVQALIIAQYKLDKSAVTEAFAGGGDEFFDIFVHASQEVTQMESAQAREGGMERLFVEAAAYLLRETFEGAPEGGPSAYLDRGVGFFSTLGGIDAAGASRDLKGTTIAAQTEHAKFYLDRLCEFLNDRTERVNWEDSWLIETVNDEEWSALRESVKHAYANALRCLAEAREWTDMKTGMAMGLIAHSAYHLGAIRQMIKQL
jgi:hypothetical protein